MAIEQAAFSEAPGVGSPDIFRLIYMSEVALPDEAGPYAAAIDEILRWSRDWNNDNGVTGALLFSDGYFAQILEGPAPVIKGLIGNIICDNRHRHLRLLECGLVPSRLFGNWSMAYTDGNEQFDLSIMDVLGLPRVSRGAALLNMLRHLVTPP